jgi:hypothetical protein
MAEGCTSYTSYYFVGAKLPPVYHRRHPAAISITAKPQLWSLAIKFGERTRAQ